MSGVYCKHCGGPTDTGMNCINRCLRIQTYTTSTTTAACQHEGWTFKTHGRCCHKCGKFLVDFGD